MENAFKKFCQQIEFNIDSNLELSQIHFANIDNTDDQNIMNFKTAFFSIPTKKQLNLYIQKSKHFFNPLDTKFYFTFINKNYSSERLFELLDFYFEFILNKDIKDLIELQNLNFDYNTNVLVIEFDSIIDWKNFCDSFPCNHFLDYFEIKDLNIKIIDKSKDYFEEQLNKQKEIEQEEFNKLINEKKETQKSSKQPSDNTSSKNNFFNKNKKFYKVTMEEFYMTHEQFVLVEGKVFEINKILTKSNLTITTICLTDETEAVIAKYFIRENEEDKYNWIKEGMYISVFGEKKQEFNSSSFCIQINKIDELKKEPKNDNAKLKRIEFSVRSSMSAMDGFKSPVELMKFAKSLGHEAIAFVDFNNIQAFPDIYNNAKKIGIKPIYGSTFSIIDREQKLLWNVKNNELIANEKYVVFDLETTSLNPRSGEIIEFGAVVVKNGVIVDTIQFFIKPSNAISKFTTELTGISQKMLDDNYKYDNQLDAVKAMLKIFEDSTLVAHNAKFDIGFIEEKMNFYNLGKIKNQVIDTMWVARHIFPISQSYRLEVIAKKVDVVYNTEVAHRADYDANVLQQVWKKMIEMLTQQEIKTFDQLSKIDDDNLNSKKRGFDLAIYAKNQKGLKKLFKLVSTSLTSNYFGSPKLFEDVLNDREDLLIGPASINSRLMELMQTGTKQDLEDEIEKWDFIGIPSPHLFSHLISRNVLTKKELEDNLKEIIYLARKKQKLIVAIGDVRYTSTDNKLAHAIYINTKGLEGKRHPLFKYGEIDPKYPVQLYLTTDEMLEQFEFLNSSDLAYEIVVENTIKLNNLFDENIEIIKSKLYPPNFDNSDKKLVELVYENARKIYGDNIPEIVKKRIQRELEPINKYGFSVVYWISQKLVSKSMSDGYLVGSRGSVGSSIVATLCGITEVNPLMPHYICKECKFVEFISDAKTTSGFDLPSKLCPKCNIELKRDGQTIPFETFLGFDGDKVPDIDLNFSGIYQPTIHQEVRNLFGEHHTFRAGTISTVASKTAFGFVKKYFDEQEISKSNHFAGYLASIIEGSKRTTGQHPGGIIIIPKEFDVEDFTPINYPANDKTSNWLTTHFDFHAIHDNVLKLDLLGHDDPTAIRQLQNLTNVKMTDISFSDEKVMKLFSSTKPLGISPEDINGEPTGVLGIPEFGTKFVRKMLRVAKPSTFNDLINISGLSHGTDVWTGNAEELVKQGKKLNDVISCRDDIMVYLMKKNIDPSLSFQIMEKVRKGKGLTPEDEKVLKENNIESWYINSLNKIKYMFPKAHATAYVIMAWRIAWFKIYYPIEYYATFFTVRSDVFDIENALASKIQIEKRLKELEVKSKDKITQKEEGLIVVFEIINEMMARGISISNINLYKSNATEWGVDYENNCLIPPFNVIDGLGEAAAKSIIEARKEKPFSSKEDLLKRTQINKTVLEKMDKLQITNELDTSDQLKLF